MDHDEKLHETVVDVAGLAGLHNKNILVTDALANGDTVEKSVSQTLEAQRPAGFRGSFANLVSWFE
ncbi:hypothetical protein ColKHC_14355 [Colletotrichum higginsianum]|nr:hypothetical protein ColKHC_14342 [Colletotrichum higginsianum]GJD05530.1 hypothetical protein ColKHC_14355 [Colletotrichum higginsianum]